MRGRCRPTSSLRPTQAKSGINAQEEARGSRARELAIGSMRATIARPKRLARQACKQQPGLSSLGCWQLRHSAGGVDSPPSVGGCMRASRARSVDLHAGGVVGARVVFHSAPIAFGMSQGCLCRMFRLAPSVQAPELRARLVCGAPLFASNWCPATAPDEEANTCIRMFKMQCGMHSHVRNAMWIVSAHSHSM